MSAQRVFEWIMLLVNAFGLIAQLYVIQTVRSDRAHALEMHLNGYYSRYSITTLRSVYLGLGAIVALTAIFALSLLDHDIPDRPVTHLQVFRAICFLLADACIVGRSAYVGIRYHQDIEGTRI